MGGVIHRGRRRRTPGRGSNCPVGGAVCHADAPAVTIPAGCPAGGPGRSPCCQDGRCPAPAHQPEPARDPAYPTRGQDVATGRGSRHQAGRPLGELSPGRRQGGPRPPHPALLASRQVRRRAGLGGLPPQRRAGRPGQLRDLRPDRRHRQVRPGPQDQVRDLCHHPDQGRHHRRAALDRLGAPFGAGQGTGGRAGVRQAGSPPPAQPGPTRKWPRSWASPRRTCRSSFKQISFVGLVALDDVLSSGAGTAETR